MKKCSECNALSPDEYFPTFCGKRKEIGSLEMSGIISPETLRYMAPEEHTQQSNSENLKYRAKHFPKRKILWEKLQEKMKQELKISGWSKNWSL